MARRSRSGTVRVRRPRSRSWLRAAHHHSADGAVAQHAFGSGARDGAEALDLALQAVELGQRSTGPQLVWHHDFGACDRSRRRAACRLGRVTEQDQRIGASLRSGAHVGRPLGRLEIVEDAPDDGRRLGIEETAEGAPGRRRGEREATLVERKAGISPRELVVGERCPSPGDPGKSCTSTVAAASSSTVSYSS